MVPILRSESKDVAAALDSLGIPLAIPQKAVKAGFLAFTSRTGNDARNAGGFYQWNETVRTISEDLRLLKWTRHDKKNFPTLSSPNGPWALTVSSGSNSVGMVLENPTTRRPKGICTAAVVSSNAAQLSLDIFSPVPELEYSETDRDKNTWFLLYVFDKKEIRSELSLPVNMNVKGYIATWRERIILPAIPLDPAEHFDVVPDFGPDVDIDIQRRA